MSEETPKCLECWKSSEEKANNGERERWINRPTFILAAIGSAIGLGNFWRFPYLTYKFGGAPFFFPYLMCLFFMGIPLLLMELSLGQKFQRGDISVFRGIHPRLAGVGLASVFSAYIITWYYNVIISWSLVYFVAAFKSPLPWSKDNTDWVDRCDPTTTTRAEEFFNIDVIRFYDDNCKPYEDGDASQFSVYAFIAVLVVWLFCFLAIFKGVKSSSYIVWVTVPLPILFIVVMIINNTQLEGAGNGIKQYLQGNGTLFELIDNKTLNAADLDTTNSTYLALTDNTTVEAVSMYASLTQLAQNAADVLSFEETQQSVWASACGQIFFSIGVCMGIMTSYGSYNPVEKPIVFDNMVISLSNSMLSFIAGFAVWSIVGFLQANDSLAQSKTSSLGLAFIAYPTAIDSMSAPNLWAIILGITLFLLGIDSAFSMVEATATVICDTKWGKKFPRMFVAFVLCLIGFLLSVPFCTNWGFVLFDVVDYYLANYLLIIVGIMQCFGCGWGFEMEATMKKSTGHTKALTYLAVSFWLFVIVLGAIFTSLEMKVVGLLVIIGCTILLSLLPSYFLAGVGMREWYEDIMMCGVKKIAYSMTKLGRPETDKVTKLWYEPLFCFWWGLTIKYGIPMVLYILMVDQIKRDVAAPYGGYAAGWQAVGMLIPAVGLLGFLLGIVVNVYEEPLDMGQFEDNGETSNTSVNKVQAAGASELAEVKDQVDLSGARE